MPDDQARSITLDIANALVALHKEQFGRGPTRVSARFAGPDALLVVLEDALLPAERALVAVGEADRVVDMRNALQNATADRFTRVIEDITGRTIRSFASAVDAANGIAFEMCLFETTPADGTPKST
jgi:uncharacterized protein YbcI